MRSFLDGVDAAVGLAYIMYVVEHGPTPPPETVYTAASVKAVVQLAVQQNTPLDSCR